MTLNINLYAGPGVGKSVTMANLFVALKLRGIHCEMVPEFAKELQYDGVLLTTPQLRIVREQLRRQSRLQGHAEVVVTDSPVPLSLPYSPRPARDRLERIVRKETAGWTCLNLLLHRDLDEGYETKGRYQDKEGAKSFHRDVMVPFVKEYHGADVVELHVEAVLPWVLDYLERREERRAA